MARGSIFHEGERLAQERTGQAAQAMRVGGVIGDRLRPGSIPFLAEQSLLVLGSVDSDRQIWASTVFGSPGFVTAPDDGTVRLDLSSVEYDADDPLWDNIVGDRRIGVLAIEPATRRRLRVNGNVRSHEPATIEIDVLEAYPNCPKYIQRREMSRATNHGNSRPAVAGRGRQLTAALRDIISSSDTFFVASAHHDRGVDVSHRGGNPGFVEVLDERTLRVPDYVGNGLYNTLGNFVSNPRAGLLFIDFEAGSTLQLTGTPNVRWELDRQDDRTGGTGRYWDFTVERWLQRTLPAPIEWTLVDYSSFNPTSARTEG